MRINTNISAITAYNQLSISQQKLEKSLERLSSGYKINHASDDAAGMAISLKMKEQLKGLSQADNNAGDGVSVIETAEGAITEIQSMLARMKELSVQSASDSNTDEDREAIQKEITSLNSEIDRIASDTEFNTQSLLSGNLERRVYTRNGVAGIEQFECSENIAADDYGITITQDARQAVVMGDTVSLNTVTDATKGTIAINGYKVAVETGDTLDDVVTKLSSAMSLLGGKSFAVAAGTTTSNPAVDPNYAGYTPVNSLSGNQLVFMTDGYGLDESLNITCDNAMLAGQLGISTAATTEGIVAVGRDAEAKFTEDLTGKRVGFADTATISTDGTMVTVKDVNNKVFKMDISGNTASTTFRDVSGTAVGGDRRSAALGSVEQDVVQEVTDIGTMTVHVGANANQVIEFDIPEISTYKLEIDHINVMTYENASKANAALDKAISRVSSIRSKLGAYTNRLEHTQANLSTSTENLTTALSRLIDTDMAEEMTSYTSESVISQAANSVLAQANARPETALQLLQK